MKFSGVHWDGAYMTAGAQEFNERESNPSTHSEEAKIHACGHTHAHRPKPQELESFALVTAKGFPGLHTFRGL